MEEAVPIERLVNDYLTRFHKHYQLPRHFPEMEEVKQWCHDYLGNQYRDWTLYVGHRNDPHIVLHILDPNWCTIFELRWAHLILGTIDIPKRF